MRLFITSCLVALFSVSAQAFDGYVTIEAEVKTPGAKHSTSVWAAYKVRLQTNGQTTCKMIFAGWEDKIRCSASTSDSDSMREQRTLIELKGTDFEFLSILAAQNSDIPQADRKLFRKYITDYSRNHDTMTNPAPVSFYLHEEVKQSKSFCTPNRQGCSKVTVFQH